MLKRVAMISILLLAALMLTGCGTIQLDGLTSDIKKIDEDGAKVDALGHRLTQKDRAELEAKFNAKFAAQQAEINRLKAGHMHVCVPACPPQHNPKPAPIVVQPVVVQPVVVAQPTSIPQPAEQPQVPEACDPCQGRQVVVVTPCTNWRNCNNYQLP